MVFYTSIAQYYDYIFPFKPPQKKFVLSFHEGNKGSILDVGCGSGSLVISLGDHFEKINGIDPDGEMLSLARLKARGSGLKKGIAFKGLGMLDLEGNFEVEEFDLVICFGNTVVHLGCEVEVKNFLEQSKRILKPGGKLLVQIINYNRILDQGLKGLPTIENDEIKFERIYSYGKKPEKVDFKTKLTIKATGKIIENSVPLLALRPGIFRNLLEEAGFTNIEEFGSFKKDLFEPDSQPYIVKAE